MTIRPDGGTDMTAMLDKIDSIMYYPILIIVMSIAGIYFTILTKGVQIRLFPESTPMNAAWALADITMGCMTLINLPSCMILGKVAIDTLKDYEKQKAQGKSPVFWAVI